MNESPYLNLGGYFAIIGFTLLILFMYFFYIPYYVKSIYPKKIHHKASLAMFLHFFPYMTAYATFIILSYFSPLTPLYSGVFALSILIIIALLTRDKLSSLKQEIVKDARN